MRAAPTERSTRAHGAGARRRKGVRVRQLALGGVLDYNLANAAGALIGFEARTPILGFNVPEAVLLGNTGRSTLQLAAARADEAHVGWRAVQPGLHVFASKDTSSADPGSTAGGGKPDVPEQRASSCRATSATSTPTTRCRTSIARTGSAAAGCGICPGRGAWRVPLSGFVQVQSGLPYSIYSVEPELANVSQYSDLVRGSGGIYRLGFGRPSLCGSLDELRQPGDDPTEAAFNKSVLCSPIDGGRRLPGQSGLRQPWPQRPARVLAAPCRPQPREGFGSVDRGTSSFAGTYSTCSTR